MRIQSGRTFSGRGVKRCLRNGMGKEERKANVSMSRYDPGTGQAVA
jgi:hypothetical protein